MGAGCGGLKRQEREGKHCARSGQRGLAPGRRRSLMQLLPSLCATQQLRSRQLLCTAHGCLAEQHGKQDSRTSGVSMRL